MWVPNSQLTANFSAKYQLTTIFGQFSVKYLFWLAINFHSPTANVIPS